MPCNIEPDFLGAKVLYESILAYMDHMQKKLPPHMARMRYKLNSHNNFITNTLSLNVPRPRPWLDEQGRLGTVHQQHQAPRLAGSE